MATRAEDNRKIAAMLRKRGPDDPQTFGVDLKVSSITGTTMQPGSSRPHDNRKKRGPAAAAVRDALALPLKKFGGDV